MEKKQNYADWRLACGSEDSEEREEGKNEERCGHRGNSRRGPPSQANSSESFWPPGIEQRCHPREGVGEEETCQKGWPWLLIMVRKKPQC